VGAYAGDLTLNAAFDGDLPAHEISLAECFSHIHA